MRTNNLWLTLRGCKIQFHDICTRARSDCALGWATALQQWHIEVFTSSAPLIPLRLTFYIFFFKTRASRGSSRRWLFSLAALRQSQRAPEKHVASCGGKEKKEQGSGEGGKKAIVNIITRRDVCGSPPPALPSANDLGYEKQERRKQSDGRSCLMAALTMAPQRGRKQRLWFSYVNIFNRHNCHACRYVWIVQFLWRKKNSSIVFHPFRPRWAVRSVAHT